MEGTDRPSTRGLALLAAFRRSSAGKACNWLTVGDVNPKALSMVAVSFDAACRVRTERAEPLSIIAR